MSKPKRLQARQATAAAAGVPSEPEQADETVKRAVLYLRVSTPSQVKTDYNPEGISLPAQRDACQLKAASLGAEVVAEFVEPGRTATSIEHRPVFQEMLAWVKGQRDVDYIVVYQFNRIFRNSVDAAITKKELSKVGTRVVPTVMDLGEGPESAMVETIMHAVDEYRSKADGADIAYKMGAKARSGGTVGRAPLGYLNARDLSEGRNIGIVTLDPERAPLVKTAFELYATDDYSLEALTAELARRGLRTKPARFPAGPVSTSKLAVLLRDPYYIGYVTYKGELIPGRHEHLIGDDLFERVQEVLDGRSGSGARQYHHHHYLKGQLWCGQCHDQGVEARMVMQLAKGNGGQYQYFFCKRKQQHQCDSRYVDSDAAEVAVADFYATIRFPADLAARLRGLLRETLDDEEKASKLLHQQLTAELVRLDTQEENLVDLAADGAVPSAKIKERLATLQRQRDKLRQRLDQTDHRLALGAAMIEHALTLLDDPHDLYQRMAPEDRRQLNRAIFEKVYVVQDKITDATLMAPFDELLRARDAVRSAATDSKEPPPAETEGGSTGNHADPLTTALLGGGSTKRVMVEMVPPDTNRRPSIAGQAIRLGGRTPAATSCRNEVLVALSALVERSGRQTFTVREVYGEMTARGTSYAEPTVFKTMQRMKEAQARPPYGRLERVGRHGFRLVQRSL